MKYLITGGCGFLGSNIASELLKREQELVIFDSLYRFGSYQNLDWLRSQGKFEFVHGDIRNSNDIERLIREQKPDVIYHLAGQVAMTTSIENPRMDFEVNALGSFNLLEAVRNYSPESVVIYSSTNKVYGDLEQFKYAELETRYQCIEVPGGFNEATNLDFHSPYGTSKGAADQYMLDFSRIYGIKTVVFRHSSMFGGTISGNGKQVRDLLYVSDTVNLYLQAVNHIEKIKGEAFNIGGGVSNSLSLLELFLFLESKLNINMPFRRLPPREGDQKVFIADISKIKKKTGWQPEVNKEEGIVKMLAWLRRQ